jgi:hypothetical protein
VAHVGEPLRVDVVSREQEIGAAPHVNHLLLQIGSLLLVERFAVFRCGEFSQYQ